MNKKTILYLAPTPPPYMGPSVATQVILNSRFVDEFKVIHLDTSDRRSLDTLNKVDLVNIFHGLKQYVSILSKLAWNHVDAVYIPVCQSTVGFLRDVPLIGISKLFKKRVVLHLRGGYFRKFYESSNKLMRKVIKKTLGCVDRMIVLGDSLKVLFHGLISEEKLLVVPNGLDVELRKDCQERAGRNPVKVLFLSNFIESKGYRDVLFSVEKVVETHKNVRYIFAGSWFSKRDRQECEYFIASRGLDDFVEFRGQVKGREKLELLEDADIFVFPTYYPFEGHPWVIVEAMAAGLPVITTDQGCIRESVIEGENGFIIPKKDPDAIAHKVTCLIEDPSLRRVMGEKSRELYAEKYTKDHFVQGMIDAFHYIFQ